MPLSLSQTPPVLKKGNDSLLWNMSGSALIHILIIFGLGFYASQSDIPQLPTTISINLNARAEVSEASQIGAGAEVTQKYAESPQLKQDQVPQDNFIHVNRQTQREISNHILVEQKRLLEEINQQNKVIQNSERIGFLGTHETRPAYLAYQEYWRQYVGEYGTEHYPIELIKNKLDGELELDIAINTEGVLKSVVVRRSSGHPSIDQAAINIAKKASPYAPLPPEIKDNIDVLHIIRTWRFNNRTLVHQSKEE